MIHYHGTPVGGSREMAPIFLLGRHAFVSFVHQEQLAIVAECCQSFAFDNGAFSAWMAGNPVSDWSGYYEWVREWHRHPGFDWAVIPDVIDGSEADNDALLVEWRNAMSVCHHGSGVPVWHLHESLHRLKRLAVEFPRVALGSSGEFAAVGDDRWRGRMNEAMSVTCVDKRPICKLHGLRMLNAGVFTEWPLASADSTNAGQNGHRESMKLGLSCAAEGAAWIAARRIEPFNSAQHWKPAPVQSTLFGAYQ